MRTLVAGPDLRLFRVIEEHDQILELNGPPEVWCGSSWGERSEDVPGWESATSLPRETFKEARHFVLQLTASAAKADPSHISPECDWLHLTPKGLREGSAQ